MKHSSIGASGSERWIHCPGSVKAESKYTPTGSRNKWADEGSAAHALAAMCLQDETDPEVYIEQWFDPQYGGWHDKKIDSDSVQVDPAMIEGVQAYIDHIDRIYNSRDNDLMFVEKTVDLSMLYPNMFGTCDCSIYKRKTRTLYTIDFKYGAGHAVEAEENSQVMFYALGEVIRLSDEFPIQKVNCVIVQPRAYHPEGPIREYEIEPHELMDFGATLVEKATEAMEAKSPSFEAGHWCRWCRHLPDCAEAQRNALQKASEIFEDVDDVEKMGRILDSVETVEAWVHGVKEHATTHFLQKGIAPTGWEIGETRKHRVWSETQEVTAKALTKLGIDPWRKLLLSPSMAEKKLPKEQRLIIKEMAHRPPGTPVLVRAGTNRRTSASDVFENEE